MPKKRKDPPQARPKANGVIEGAGEVVEQRITRTLEENYMPYAMSVILSSIFLKLSLLWFMSSK